jgi:hypothetical protein
MSDYNAIEFTEANNIYDILQEYCKEQGLNFLNDNNRDFNRRETLSIFYQFIKRYVVDNNKNKK